MKAKGDTSYAAYPHCDSAVLHEPGRCDYCDEYPAKQAARLLSKINYTGNRWEGFGLCPSEMSRDLATINKWEGNVPHRELPKTWVDTE
jgi:hypothetical protein